MVKSDEDFEEKVGEKPDGMFGKYVTMGSDEGKYLVSVPIEEVKKTSRPKMSTDRVEIVSQLFKGLLKKVPDDLDVQDLEVYIEIDSDNFTEECKAACEQTSGAGAFYTLRESEVKNERTKFVPKVIDKTGDKNG